MQPQLPQIEKLATALNVSPNALLGLNNPTFRLETVGDFMGFLIMLLNSNVLCIDGERNQDNMLKSETVNIHFVKNSIFSKIVKISICNNENGKKLFNSENFSFDITSPFILPDLLKWEKVNYLYRLLLSNKEKYSEAEFNKTVNDIQQTKEKLELELQRSPIMPGNDSGGISVKIGSDLTPYL